jgi:hypothetical protein
MRLIICQTSIMAFCLSAIVACGKTEFTGAPPPKNPASNSNGHGAGQSDEANKSSDATGVAGLDDENGKTAINGSGDENGHSTGVGGQGANGKSGLDANGQLRDKAQTGATGSSVLTTELKSQKGSGELDVDTASVFPAGTKLCKKTVKKLFKDGLGTKIYSKNKGDNSAGQCNTSCHWNGFPLGCATRDCDSGNNDSVCKQCMYEKEVEEDQPC